ncbi:MAG: Na+/H+ antiporter NhaC family protein [Brevinema sp.]
MRVLPYALFSVVFMPHLGWGLEPSEIAQNLGILTILAPAVAIMLALKTKQVYFSLFIGMWVGAFLLAFVDGFQFQDLYTSFDKMINTMISVLSNSWNMSIIAQVITIGGLIGIIGKNGGSYAVASAISKKAKNAVSAQLLTCFTALFIFFDDYANCLITGPVMRPVTDKLKVSREKLSFIIDATAAPIAGIALISTWIGYELGVIRDSYSLAGVVDPNTYGIFIQTIPYRFYNILMLGFVILVASMKRDFGPMLKAEQRARQTGVTARPDSESEKDNALNPEPNIKHYKRNALIPIFVLIAGAFGGIWNTGYQNLLAENVNFTDNLSTYDYILQILGTSDVMLEIFKASMLASIVAMILSALTKTMKFFDALNVWVIGAKQLISTTFVLLLAWSITSIIKELGTSIFLTQMFRDSLAPQFIPVLTFILSCFISFSTGSAFGTMGIIMPLAVPIAATLTGNPDSIITLITSGAVLSGAIMGDHCSPISDTTILSSSGAECALIDHVNTQLPYSIAVAIISILAGYILVGFGIPVYFSYIVGFISLAIILYTIGKNPETHPIEK